MKLNSIIINTDSTGEQMKIKRIFSELGIDTFTKDDDYIEVKLMNCAMDKLMEALERLKSLKK